MENDLLHLGLLVHLAVEADREWTTTVFCFLLSFLLCCVALHQKTSSVLYLLGELSLVAGTLLHYAPRLYRYQRIGVQ